MKKFVFALVAVLALGMASCGHKGSTPEAQTATDLVVVVTDSVTVDSVATDSVIVL